MNKILILVLAIIFSANVFSQPAIQWQKCLGGTLNDYAYSAKQTSDGGYILAGGTYSNNADVTGNHGSADFWIVKLNSTGSIQWKKCYGGTGAEGAVSIEQTSDGGYIAVGTTTSNDGDVSGNHSNAGDYWIVKLDITGNLQWQKCYGGTASDNANFIEQTNDGGYIAAGITFSNDGDVSGFHGTRDYWIVKVDSLGNLQWQKSLGGAAWDEAYSVEQTADGGYFVAGFTSSNNGDVSGHHGPGVGDYWVVKLDNGGNIQWQKCYGGTSDDLAYSSQHTTDGGFVVAGYSFSNDGDVSGNHGAYDYWIAKLDTNGTLQWQKSLGGTGLDEAFSIRQTSDGGYIVGGSSSSNNGDVSGNHGGYRDFWTVKLDNLGNLQWQKCLGGTNLDKAYSVQQTTDGGFIVAGQTHSNNGDVSLNRGGDDYWVVKLAPYVGIEANSLSYQINIYPNPASNEIEIHNLKSEIRNIEIYDMLGQSIFSQQPVANSQQLVIDISALPNGIYFLQLRSSSQTRTQKFIISR